MALLPNLDPTVTEKLRKADRKLYDVLPLFDAAEKCGIDVSALRATHQEMRQQVDAYKSQFFGG